MKKKLSRSIYENRREILIHAPEFLNLLLRIILYWRRVHIEVEILHLTLLLLSFFLSLLFFFFHEYSPLSLILPCLWLFQYSTSASTSRKLSKKCPMVFHATKSKLSVPPRSVIDNGRIGRAWETETSLPASILLYLIRDKYFFPLYCPGPSS